MPMLSLRRSQDPRRRGAQTEPARPAFDHLMHWVPNLPAAAAAYRTAGFPVELNKPRPGTGVQNGGWWKELHYVELLAVLDADQARTSTLYGGFTTMILPAVQSLLADGGGALNIALAVPSVDAHVDRWRAAGLHADQHTVTLPVGPTNLGAYTLGWLTDSPPWAPFVIRYHPLLRTIQRLVLPVFRRRQPGFDLHRLVIEVPEPADSARWLAERYQLATDSSDPLTVDLGSCEATFVSGNANRVTTVELTGPHPPHQTINGLTWECQSNGGSDLVS